MTSCVVGGRLRLDVGVVGSGALQYQWRKGQSLLGQNDATLLVDDVQLEDAGNYSVMVSNAAGRTLSYTVQVFVNEQSPERPFTELVNPPFQAALSSIVFGNGRFVAATNLSLPFGTGAVLLTHSPNGTWWKGGSIAILPYSPVVFGDGTFLLGGVNHQGKAAIIYSHDGAGWGAANVPEVQGMIREMAHGAGNYVASGPAGTFWSEDGIDWELSSNAPADISAISYGDGFFLGTKSGLILRSIDGQTWQSSPAPVSDIASFRFAGGRWWLLRFNGGPHQSLDGVHWAEAGINSTFSDILFSEGLFLAADPNAELIHYGSGDGADWGVAPLGYRTAALAEGRGRVIGISQGRFWVRNAVHPPSVSVPPTLIEPVWVGASLHLEVEASGSEPLHYEWRKIGENLPLPGQTSSQLIIEDIVSGDAGGYQVKVSNPYGIAISQPVSVQVAPTPPVISQPWVGPTSVSGGTSRITFGDGRFVATGTNVLRHSRDGVFWRGGLASNMVFQSEVCFGDGKFVVGGREVTPFKPAIFYSEDGAAWAAASLPAGIGGDVILSVAWGDGTFVAGGGNGGLWSEDAIHWQQAAGPTIPMRSIAYGSGFFLGVTHNGAILKSVDGLEWVAHGQAFSQGPNFLRLKFVAGRFFIHRNPSDPLLISADGVAWTENIVGTSDVLAANETLLAVGPSNAVRYGTADGSRWESRGAPIPLQGIAQGSGRIVGVGFGTRVRTANIEPYAATQTEPFAAISGETAEMTVTPIGKPPFVFSWFRGDNWIVNTSEPVLEIENVSPEDEGEYRLRITSASGSTWSDPFHLVVHVPPAIVAQPGTMFASPGETVHLAVQIAGSEPMEFAWSKNEDALGQTSQPTLTIESIGSADAGEYRLAISNAAGEITSDPIALRVILTYEDWTDRMLAEGALEPGQLDPGADLAGTGVANLLRYALNLPVSGNVREGLPRVEFEVDPEDPSQKTLLFIFQRRKDAQDLALRIEQSGNLGLWTHVDVLEADISVEDAGGVEIVTLRYPLEGDMAEQASEFFRLAAEIEE